MVHLVEEFGFRLIRVKGNHHMFSHPIVPELVNRQEVGGRGKTVIEFLDASTHSENLSSFEYVVV